MAELHAEALEPPLLGQRLHLLVSSRRYAAASRSSCAFSSLPVASANSRISVSGDSSTSSGKNRHSRKQMSVQRQLHNHSHRSWQNGAQTLPSAGRASRSVR